MMNTNDVMNKAKGIFTAKRIKIGAAILAVCAVAAGGGMWYMHDQKQARKAQIAQAQMRMVQYQASQQNLNLLDEAQAKTLAAQAIGLDENVVTFRSVALKNKWDDDAYRDTRKHHKEHRGDDRRNVSPQQPPAPPVNGQPASQNVPNAPAVHPAAPNAPQGQHHNFFPVYDIKATADGLTYDIEINAATGEVLDSEVEHKY